MKVKRFFTYAAIFSCCLLVAVSCGKIEQIQKAFDFSHIEGMDGGGEWGVSMVDATYTIADLLNMTDKDDQYIEVSEDGLLSFVYRFNRDTLITAGEIMDVMVGKEFVFSGDVVLPSIPAIPPPGLSFNLYDSLFTTTGITYSDFALDTVQLRSGKIRFNISHNCPLDIRIDMSSPNIVESDGSTFTRTFNVTGREQESVLDLSGCNFLLTDSTLAMILHLTCVSTGDALPNNMRMRFTIKLGDFSIHKIYGNCVPVVIDTSLVEAIDLGNLSGLVSGSLTLNNPQIDFYLFNSIPIPVNLDLQRLALKGNGYYSSLINATDVPIRIPASTSDFVKMDIPIASSIKLSTALSAFDFSGKATINPMGKSSPPMRILDDQYIGLRASVKVPVDLNVDDLYIRDTVNFGSSAVNMEDIVKNLVLRLKMENGIPLDMQVQVYFCDSADHMRINDSLFTTATSISGGYEQPVTTVKYVEIKDIDQINRILTSDKAIISARIHTAGRQVKFRTSQFLRCAITAKANVDYGQLFNELKNKKKEDKE